MRAVQDQEEGESRPFTGQRVTATGDVTSADITTTGMLEREPMREVCHRRSDSRRVHILAGRRHLQAQTKDCEEQIQPGVEHECGECQWRWWWRRRVRNEPETIHRQIHSSAVSTTRDGDSQVFEVYTDGQGLLV